MTDDHTHTPSSLVQPKEESDYESPSGTESDENKGWDESYNNQLKNQSKIARVNGRTHNALAMSYKTAFFILVTFELLGLGFTSTALYTKRSDICSEDNVWLLICAGISTGLFVIKGIQTKWNLSLKRSEHENAERHWATLYIDLSTQMGLEFKKRHNAKNYLEWVQGRITLLRTNSPPASCLPCCCCNRISRNTYKNNPNHTVNQDIYTKILTSALLPYLATSSGTYSSTTGVGMNQSSAVQNTTTHDSKDVVKDKTKDTHGKSPTNTVVIEVSESSD